METDAVTKDWLVQSSSATDTQQQPNYWNNGPTTLFSTADIHNTVYGTGSTLFNNSIIPAIAQASHEVLIVTCFWARSRSLDALNAALATLSAKAAACRTPIRVRIGFSSTSLLQKLSHTSSPSGQTWPPSKWTRVLGLPSPEQLPGLEIEVKSIFLLPFSVMHPKFVLIDRARVLLPSCNVSWEAWFEGCVDLRGGEIVAQFVRFWTAFWASERDLPSPYQRSSSNLPLPPAPHHQAIQCLFLPSPYHRNPNFPLLPCCRTPAPPPTPLNLFLLSAFALASHTIFLQTPNLTSPPVLRALRAALRRGVAVSLRTSRSLMVLEQLLTTAGAATTARATRALTKWHARRQHGEGDPEAPLGKLRVEYFLPRRPARRRQQVQQQQQQEEEVPVQSHLKLTILDGRWTVFGSGNMDRASWYTSQELGVAFFSERFAAETRREVEGWMEGRCEVVYDC